MLRRGKQALAEVDLELQKLRTNMQAKPSHHMVVESTRATPSSIAPMHFLYQGTFQETSATEDRHTLKLIQKARMELLEEFESIDDFALSEEKATVPREEGTFENPWSLMDSEQQVVANADVQLELREKLQSDLCFRHGPPYVMLQPDRVVPLSPRSTSQGPSTVVVVPSPPRKEPPASRRQRTSEFDSLYQVPRGGALLRSTRTPPPATIEGVPTLRNCHSSSSTAPRPQGPSSSETTKNKKRAPHWRASFVVKSTPMDRKVLLFCPECHRCCTFETLVDVSARLCSFCGVQLANNSTSSECVQQQEEMELREAREFALAVEEWRSSGTVSLARTIEPPKTVQARPAKPLSSHYSVCVPKMQYFQHLWNCVQLECGSRVA